MSNDYFNFKRFTVHQSQAAMKVGTDGCLLGAWVPIDSVKRVLDIGTGTGLLALMCSQRISSIQSDFQIDAIEIEPSAAAQAEMNVAESEWASSIHIIQGDVLTFSPELRYDLIVCNPPYFVDSLKCPGIKRNLARHTESLPFSQLIKKAHELLNPSGSFCLVLPIDLSEDFISQAKKQGFSLKQEVSVHTTEKKEAKRVLLNLSLQVGEASKKEKLIIQTNGEYTDHYKSLLKDFYLKL